MARTDAIVLGAGIVGVSVALQLVKRGLSVALVDRGPPGAETSYGNAGVLEGQTLFPPSFPARLTDLVKIALKQSAQANYHLSFLPQVAPWLLAYRANTTPEGSLRFAQAMRPLFSRAVESHETLMREADALRYLRKDGWIKLYRSERTFADTRRERDYARELGVVFHELDPDAARVLEPSLSPVFHRALHWPGAASISNPLGVTRAYAALFSRLGGVVLQGDADTLHRTGSDWRIDTREGALDSRHVVIALGPWSPDLVARFGFTVPMKWKRGYHRHFAPRGNAGLTRPIVDTEYGYCLLPMEQGIRITTGAEFAHRDAPPTPVQLDRLKPAAQALFPLGDPLEETAWKGSRPCFADSRPMIGAVPGQPGMIAAFGHAHWGLTLGPVTGLLVADLITGATPFCDPTPYSTERF